MGYAKTPEQPFRRTSTGCMSNPVRQFSDSPGPPGAGQRALLDLLSETLPRATVVAAPPSSHMNINANRQSLHWQILQMPLVRSFATAGRLAAIRASIRSRAYPVYNQRTTTFNNIRNLDVSSATRYKTFLSFCKWSTPPRYCPQSEDDPLKSALA